MTYNTIPIPEFSFYDVPEREAEAIANVYFQSIYNTGYYIETAKNDIRSKIIMQESKDDKIVMLSYLINKLAIRMLTLPLAKTPMELSVRHNDTIPTYTALLHFLYRLIEQEGIEIPTGLFDIETYKSSQALLISVNDTLEQYGLENPDQLQSVLKVQEEIVKCKKFLWLGKEDWVKIFIGQIVTCCVKEGLTPLLPTIMISLKAMFMKLIQ